MTKGVCMKKVAIILADGFEEIEAVSVIDILRRCTIGVEVLSINDLKVTGGHGLTIVADEIFDYYSVLDFDAIVFAGGMKNAIALSENSGVLDVINYYHKNEKFVCGICATPAIVFAKTNILSGANFTCYPDSEMIADAEKKSGGNFIDEEVVFSENILTSQSPSTAIHFALAICEILGYDSSVVINELKGV